MGKGRSRANGGNATGTHIFAVFMHPYLLYHLAKQTCVLLHIHNNRLQFGQILGKNLYSLTTMLHYPRHMDIRYISRTNNLETKQY